MVGEERGREGRRSEAEGRETTEGKGGESPSAAARRRGFFFPRRRRRRRRLLLAAAAPSSTPATARTTSAPPCALRAGDSLLVRRSRGLERLLRERAAAETETADAGGVLRQHPPLSRALDASLSSALTEGARAFVWDTAEELRALVEALLLLCEEKAAEVLLSDL